jgi:F0F1-type ATP synthase delta subunit
MYITDRKIIASYVELIRQNLVKADTIKKETICHGLTKMLAIINEQKKIMQQVIFLENEQIKDFLLVIIDECQLKNLKPFFFTMVDFNHLYLIDSIINDFLISANKSDTSVDVRIYSPFSLSSLQISKISKIISDEIKKTVYPNVIIQPDIIGGFVIETDNNFSLDNSILLKVKRIFNSLGGVNV